MYKPLCWALSAACLILFACATPAPAPQPVAPPRSENPPPVPDAGLRRVPHSRPPGTETYYPAVAKRLGLTGRVLVEFRIDGHGRATQTTVVAAEADPALQKAAVHLVESVTFDLSSKDYDPSDPRPFYLSVEFCLHTCGDLKAYPGYGQNDLIVTAAKLPAA